MRKQWIIWLKWKINNTRALKRAFSTMQCSKKCSLNSGGGGMDWRKEANFRIQVRDEGVAAAGKGTSEVSTWGASLYATL